MTVPPATQDAAAQAYYHFSLGHYYEEMAGFAARGEFIGRAIEEYKLALRFAPDSAEIVVSLANAYRRAGRIREAVQEAQAALVKNPDDLVMHRLLGRIYFQTLGDDPEQARGRATLAPAIEEYEHIVRLAPQDTEARLTLARLYRFQGNLDRVEQVLEELLRIDPGSEEALSEMGLVYSMRGEHQRAIDLLQGSAVGTDSVQLLTRLAYAYEEAGENEKAIETYRQAVRLQEGNPQLRGRLAEALFRAERFEEALSELQALLAFDPGNIRILLRISQAHRFLRQYDEAEEVLRRAREIQPEDLDLAFNHALLRQEQGDFKGAEEILKEVLGRLTLPDGRYSDTTAFQRAVVLEQLGILQRDTQQFAAAIATFEQLKALGDEHRNRAWVQIVETYRQERRLEAATAAGEAALQQFPDDARLKLQVAGVLGERGEVDRAVAMAREQLEAGLPAFNVLLAVAQIYERNKQYAEALAVLDQAQGAAAEPGDTEVVHFLRGAVHERQGQLEAAEGEFRRVLDLNPENTQALNYLGYMLADNNLRLEEARDLIERAVEADPYNSAYLDSLGWVYFRLGRMDLAEKYLLQATERSSNDPTLFDHLGEVYHATDRLALAEQAWERAMTLWRSLPANDLDPEERAALEQKLRQLKIQLAEQNRNPGRKPPN